VQPASQPRSHNPPIPPALQQAAIPPAPRRLFRIARAPGPRHNMSKSGIMPEETAQALVARWLATFSDMDRMFAQLDYNGDGFVTCSELERAVSKFGTPWRHLPAALLAVGDHDSDGQLSLTEFCGLAALRMPTSALEQFIVDYNSARQLPPGNARAVRCSELYAALPRDCAFDAGRVDAALRSPLKEPLRGRLEGLTHVTEGLFAAALKVSLEVPDSLKAERLELLMALAVLPPDNMPMQLAGFIRTELLRALDRQPPSLLYVLQQCLLHLNFPSGAEHERVQQWKKAVQKIVPPELPWESSALAGCLTGLVTGDAIGSPVELEPAFGKHTAASKGVEAFCAELDGSRLPTLGRTAGGNFMPGQCSDDGQLARELLLSVVQASNVHAVPDVFALRMALAVQSGAMVGAGGGTVAAAQRIAKGVPIQADDPAASVGNSGNGKSGKGNGSCMRVAPFGLLFDKPLVARLADEQSCVSHSTSLARAAAVAIALCAQAARDHRSSLSPGEFPIQAVMDVAREVAAINPQYADLLRVLPQLLKADLKVAIDRVMAAGTLCGDPPAPSAAPITGASMKGSIWCGAGHSSAWAILAFLRHPSDFVKCVRFAVSGGGDTDTTAAMAGALCGAHVGLKGIPPAWLAGIHDRGQWGALRLVDLCAKAQEVVGHWGQAGGKGPPAAKRAKS